MFTLPLHCDGRSCSPLYLLKPQRRTGKELNILSSKVREENELARRDEEGEAGFISFSSQLVSYASISTRLDGTRVPEMHYCGRNILGEMII